MQRAFKSGAFLVSRSQIFSPKVVRNAGGGGDVFKDNERAAEKIFFDKEERKTMKKLLQKLDKEAHISGTETSDRPDQIQKLQSLFSKYKVTAPNALLEDIIDWKQNE